MADRTATTTTTSEDIQSWLAAPWGWLIIWAPCLAVLIAVALILGSADVHPWAPSIDRIFEYRKEQREDVTDTGLFVQLANFWSNFAYLAVGLVMFLRSGTFVGRGTGMAFVFLAVMSGFFHGTLTSTGQTLDIVGVYLALLGLMWHGFVEAFDMQTSSQSVRDWFWFLMLCGLFMGFTKGDIPWHGSDIVAGVVGLTIVVLMIVGFFNNRPKTATIEEKRAADTNWTGRVIGPAFFVLFFFILAGLFKYGDFSDVKSTSKPCIEQKNEAGMLLSCAPAFDYEITGKKWFVWDDDSWAFGKNSVLQGHALWHVFSALGMLCIFEYFTSLRRKGGSVLPWRS